MHDLINILILQSWILFVEDKYAKISHSLVE